MHLIKDAYPRRRGTLSDRTLYRSDRWGERIVATVTADDPEHGLGPRVMVQDLPTHGALTPDQARMLADMLRHAADCAEGLTVEPETLDEYTRRTLADMGGLHA